MDIRLTITTVWHVTPEDETMANKLLEMQDEEAIVDNILDAVNSETGEYDKVIATAVKQ